MQNRIKFKPGHPNIEIVKEYGDLPKVECYPGPINQVFMNILSNAIDALDDYSKHHSYQQIPNNPSKISVRTQLIDRDYVEIKIADSGPGIKSEVKQKIFDPFFTTKPVGKGTGLGLSISYQIIVERHGGKLECNSELGHGTEFVIKIPIRQPNQNTASVA